jgi:hypothetical protein
MPFREIVGNLKNSDPSTHIGKDGTVTIDTVTKQLFVHDGKTAGGIPNSATSVVTDPGTGTDIIIQAGDDAPPSADYPYPRGASVIIKSGNDVSTGGAGDINIQAGFSVEGANTALSGGSSGSAGTVYLAGGAVFNNLADIGGYRPATGAAISAQGATCDGNGNGSGGDIFLIAGAGQSVDNTTFYRGGDVEIYGGNAAFNNSGGGVSLFGGEGQQAGGVLLSGGMALGTDATGGSIFLQSTAGTGTGTSGDIILQVGGQGNYILSLKTADPMLGGALWQHNGVICVSANGNVNSTVANNNDNGTVIPLTGTTFTIPSNQMFTTLTPSGTLAALTVVLPLICPQAALIEVFSTQVVTALTVTAPTGTTLVGTAPTTLAANATFKYRCQGTKYYKV